MRLLCTVLHIAYIACHYSHHEQIYKADIPTPFYVTAKHVLVAVGPKHGSVLDLTAAEQPSLAPDPDIVCLIHRRAFRPGHREARARVFSLTSGRGGDR